MNTVRGLHADLELRVVVLVEDIDVAHGRLDQRLRRQGSPYLRCRSLPREPALTPMRIGNALVAGAGDHLAHLVVAADIARIDAQAVDAVLEPPRRAMR
jgi:hypothetical protein